METSPNNKKSPELNAFSRDQIQVPQGCHRPCLSPALFLCFLSLCCVASSVHFLQRIGKKACKKCRPIWSHGCKISQLLYARLHINPGLKMGEDLSGSLIVKLHAPKAGPEFESLFWETRSTAAAKTLHAVMKIPRVLQLRPGATKKKKQKQHKVRVWS